MSKRVRTLDQRDWDQLLIVAAGYLPLVGGDLKAAMARAIAAHTELVSIVKKEGIRAELPRGVAHLFSEEGDIKIAYETKPQEDTPDLAMEVPERPPRN